MELYDFHSAHSEAAILVISHRGRLRKLVCPFRVLCIKSTGTLIADHWYFVQAIGNSNGGTCYYIERKYYIYSSFHIYVMY